MYRRFTGYRPGLPSVSPPSYRTVRSLWMSLLGLSADGAAFKALESTKCQYRQETTSHVGGRGHPRAIALRNTKLPPPAGRVESRDGVRAGRTGHQIGAWSDRALGVKGGGMLGQWYTLSPPPPVWEMPKTRLTRSEGPPTPSPG